MRRLLYMVLMLLVSVTLWAGNAQEEEDWLILKDSATFHANVEKYMDALEFEESIELVSFIDFNNGVSELNEQIAILDNRGEYNNQMFFPFCESLYKIAQKYSELKKKCPGAGRIAGVLLAETEIVTNDLILGYAYDAFYMVAEAEWGEQNEEKAQFMKDVAEQIRADYESFK